MTDIKLNLISIAKSELYECKINDDLIINIKRNDHTYDITISSTNDSVLEDLTVYESDYDTYSDDNDYPNDDNDGDNDDDYDEDYEDDD